LDAVSKAGARFDLRKLRAFNGHHIRAMSPEAFATELCRRLPDRDHKHVRIIAPLVQPRLVCFSDAPEYTRFFFEDVDYAASLLRAKNHTVKGSRTMLAEVLKWLDPLPEAQFTAPVLDEKTRATAEQDHNWKARYLFMIVRAAVTGRTATPPLFDTMVALDQIKKGTCVRRLKDALKKLADA